MKKSKTTKKVVAAKPTLVDALSKLPSSTKWVKLSASEKAEFEKARFAEKQSKKAGFVLGGSLKQVL